MPKQARHFKVSESKLRLQCLDVLDSIQRDITEFTDRGFTPAKKLAFETMIATCDAYPGDKYLKGRVRVKTAAKKALAQQCKVKMRRVLTAAANTWGRNSNEYHNFLLNKTLSHLSDAELHVSIRELADDTANNLAALATEGISNATVLELRALRVQFDEALGARRQERNARLKGNSTRIAQHNLLYALLVQYCVTGKNIWYQVDASRYRNYLIADRIAAAPAKKVADE